MGLVISLLLLLGSPAFAGKVERINGLLAAASEAYQRGDLDRALARVDRAIALDSQSQQLRWMRVELLARYPDTGGALTSAEVTTTLMQECANIIRIDPNSDTGRFAAGLLKKMIPDDLFPEPRADCSAEAVANYESAEALFARRDMAGARRAYDQALALCPEHPVWWLYAGDAAFAVGAVDDALSDYDRSLSLAPCFWVAHRFIADVVLRTGGDPAVVYDHLVSAVACNPTYDLAWNDLETMVGERWRRVLPQPEQGAPLVSVGPAGKGEVAVELSADPWGAWQRALAQEQDSELDRHRLAARAGLAELAPLMAAEPGRDYGLWSVLAQAEGAGQLDAALFLLSEDRALLGEYLSWREAHPGESEALIRGALAPWSAP